MRHAAYCLLALFLLPMLSAQSQNRESLLIGPGDLVHVVVFGEPELEERARVTDTGDLPLLMGGNVQLANTSPEQAAQSIERVFTEKHLLLKPRVLVNVEEYATQKVVVIGEVHNPGTYAIATARPILDVLSLAGGLTELADRNLVIQHRANSQRTNYFLSNNPDTALNRAVEIAPGDTVIVPKAGIVYMLGDVRAPGGYTMTNNSSRLSALELLARAGGTNTTAVPSRAKLLRKSATGYSEVKLPLSAMQKGKAPDVALQPDDVVYVPFSYLKNLAASGNGIVSTLGSASVYRF